MVNPFFKGTFLSTIFKRKVLESQSKGIDKISAKMAQEKGILDFSNISTKCRNQLFKFTPYLEFLKVKNRDSNPRMISIPTVRDKVVLLAVKEYLHLRFKERVNKRLPNSYLQAVKKFVGNNSSREIYFLKIDIHNFYGEISHDHLLTILQDKGIPKYLETLLLKAIRNPTVPHNYNKRDLHKYTNVKGVPQGLSISNILAEIYLTDLDLVYLNKKYLYLRYVDDIFILMTTNKITQVESSIIRKLQSMGLRLNIEKTRKGGINKNGVTFLGYDILGETVSISKNNFHKIISKIANKITWLKKCLTEPSYAPFWIRNKKRLKEVFIEEINEKITGAKRNSQFYGWMFYFIESNDIDLLFKLDSIVEDLIIQSKIFKHRPAKLKRFVRTYFEIKHNEGGNYIVDYNKITTLLQKRRFLVRRGKIDPNGFYKDSELEVIFDKVVKRNINDLEKDVSYKYF